MARVWSDELQDLLGELTPKQRAAVPKLANAIVMGRGVAHLLRGAEKVCSEHTYYRKPRPGTHGAGWHHQPRFRQALDLAVDELNSCIVESFVDQAVKIMAEAMPKGAELWATEVQYGGQALKRLNRRGDTDKAPMLSGGQVELEKLRLRADVELAKVGDKAVAELADRVSEMTARKGTSEADLVAQRLADFMLGGEDGDETVADVGETVGAV